MNAGSPYLPPMPSRSPQSSAPQRRNLWWRELAVGLLSGAVVAGGSLYGQTLVDDQRSERETVIAQRMADEADRRENLRFVRDRSADDMTAKPFSDIDLTGQSPRGLKLNKSDFNGAVLAQTYFDNSSLVGSTFVDTKFTKASFAGADLSGATIFFSRGDPADFSDATLTEAKILYSTFDRSVFRGANLTRAHVSSSFVRVDLSEAKLTGGRFQGTNFTGANFSGADLRGADLSGSVLKDTVWKSVVRGQVFSLSGEVNSEVTLIPCADASTIWPEGFVAPETKAEGCEKGSTQRSLIESAEKFVKRTEGQ
jgi:uncharacterized protein YjbI with pentapeptide repeats